MFCTIWTWHAGQFQADHKPWSYMDWRESLTGSIRIFCTMKVATVLESSLPMSMVLRHNGIISVDRRKLITPVSSTYRKTTIFIWYTNAANPSQKQNCHPQRAQQRLERCEIAWFKMDSRVYCCLGRSIFCPCMLVWSRQTLIIVECQKQSCHSKVEVLQQW